MLVSVRQCCSAVSLATLLSAMVLGAGCATNGRQILLKEYGPTATPLAGQPLKGATICIKPFNCSTNLTSRDRTTKPEQPAQFTFVEFTDEQSKAWDQEFRAL